MGILGLFNEHVRRLQPAEQEVGISLAMFGVAGEAWLAIEPTIWNQINHQANDLRRQASPQRGISLVQGAGETEQGMILDVRKRR